MGKISPKKITPKKISPKRKSVGRISPTERHGKRPAVYALCIHANYAMHAPCCLSALYKTKIIEKIWNNLHIYQNNVAVTALITNVLYDNY